jgi:hypothetical protein
MPGANEWWAALGALSVGAGAVDAAAAAEPQVAAAEQEVAGVAAVVNPGVIGNAGADRKVLFVGGQVVRNEVITTDEHGQADILFTDQSSITLGPNATVKIDEFVYDPHTDKGKLVATLSGGLMRFVGGRISKKEEVVVNTPAATIGIRGGITIVQHKDGQTTGGFLFGQRMRMSSPDGQQSQTVTRQGFGITSNGSNLQVSRIPQSTLAFFNSQLSGNNNNRNVGNGGVNTSNLTTATGGNQNPSRTAADSTQTSTTDSRNRNATNQQPDNQQNQNRNLQDTLQTKTPVQS